jgi:alpha-beta hydrolase superfamily lysophospholipase
MPRSAPLLAAVTLAVSLSGCAAIQNDLSKGLGYGKSSKKTMKARELAASKVTTIGVNAYLWRAALDTVSFMPLVQADSNGGVIVTDWYANPSSPNERMKLTVSILDQDLRADAIKVAALRQVSQGNGWVDAPVQAATVQKLEEIILTKARDLRRSAVAG